MDILPGTVHTVRGAGTGQVPDLCRPLIVRRDIFEDILADAEVKVQTTLQRWGHFADVATSTPIPRPMKYLQERTQHSGASLVPFLNQGLYRHLEQHKDLFEEGFSHSLQAEATEFRKLREPEVAKLKGVYSSKASIIYQS